MQDDSKEQKPEEQGEVPIMRPIVFKKAASPKASAADVEAAARQLQEKHLSQEKLQQSTQGLIKLIKDKGPVGDMRRLLKSGVDLDSRDEFGNGLVHLATGANNVEALALLIRAGADVHAKNNDGVTALFAAAACYGRDDAGVMLASVDPDLSVHAMEGYHAIHIAAAKYNKTRMVEVMLQRGVPADIKDPEGRTPLFYAIAGKRDAAEVLCMAGGFHPADMSSLKEALAVKPQYGDNIKFDLLLEYAAKQDPLKLKQSFPRMDAQWPEPQLWEAQELFHKLKSSNSNDYMFSYHGSREILNARDYDGRTPLMVAFTNHSAQRNADVLWQSDPEARDNAGRTPLHHAAENSCSSAMEDYLIDRTRDIDAQDVFGRTPLMMAVIANCSQSVEALLKAGADPEIEDCLGLTAYDLVKIHDRKYVEDCLPERTEECRPRRSKGWGPR